MKTSKVASRLKEIWPNIKKIVGYWEKLPASKRPSSKSYLAVKKGVEDELLVAKLSSFSYIASLLQPYLTKYQTDDPMLPFLGKDLEGLHRSLLLLVIKPDALDKCESPAALLQIDFSDKSIYLKLKDIHFGFSTEEELKNLQRQDKVSSTDVKAFEKEAAIMVISIVEKLSEKSPLNYCLVRTADAFDPVLMVSSTSLHLRNKMKKLLTHLVSLKIISSTLAEKAMPQYLELLTTLNQDHFENAKAFDHQDCRLDDFFFQKPTLKIPNELKSILKLVLVISHGQASVERGFNTNKSISKANLSEKSMVSRKMIIDHMQKKNLLPSTIELTNKFIKSVKCAHQRYHFDLEEQRKKAKSDLRNQQLEILNAEMTELMQRKQLLVDACKNLDNEFI